jgi:hypothetical protein
MNGNRSLGWMGTVLLLFGQVSLRAAQPAPSFRWVQSLGGAASTQLDHLVVDEDGNRYAMGTFQGTFTSESHSLASPDRRSIFIVKTTSQGQTLWLRRVTTDGDAGINDATVNDAVVDRNGALVLTGSFAGRVAFGDSVLNSRGSTDLFLVRYDAAGNVVWVRQAGGNAVDTGLGLRLDDANHIYVTGFIGDAPLTPLKPLPSIATFGGGLGGGPLVPLATGIAAGFLAKYDPAGALVWAQALPGGESMFVNFVGGSSPPAVAGERAAQSLVVPFDEAKGLQTASAYTFIQGDPEAQHAFLSYEVRPTAAVGTIGYAGQINVGSVRLETPASLWWLFGQLAIFGRSMVTGEITFARDTDEEYRVASDDAGNFYAFPITYSGDSHVAKLDPISGQEVWSLPTRGAQIRSVVPLPDGSLLIGGYGSGTLGLGLFTITAQGESTAFIARVSATPTIDWVRNAGGPSAHASAESVAVDAAGNRYVTGWFRGDALFSGSPQKSTLSSVDCFLAKYDKHGEFQWVRPVGGKDFDTGRSVAVDRAGNCYVAGDFNGTASFGITNLVSKGSGDVFLAKYNREGVLLWVQSAGGSGDDYLGQLIVDPGGNCFVTGSFSATADFGGTQLTSVGSADVFLAKYSSAGTPLWVKQAGGTQDDRGFGVSADATGNLLLTGFFTSYATFGTLNVSGYGSHDVFLAKYDATGRALWVSKAGGTGIDNGYAVAQDDTGNAFVTGIIRSNSDFGGIPVPFLGFYDVFVAKFSPSGRCLWAKAFGSTNADDQAEGIAVDRSGNCYVTGEFRNTATFGGYTLTSKGANDAFLLELAGDTGDVLWVKQAGGTGDDLGYGIAFDGDRNWTWAGLCRGTLDFDQQTLVATADDFFLATSVSSYNERLVGSTAVEGILGSPVTIPIWIGARGNENALSFTLRFDPTVLTNVTVVSGDGTQPSPLSHLLVNPSRLAEGLLGVTAAADAGVALPAGGLRILAIQATIVPGTPAASTSIRFGDEVLLREVDDARGQYLNADFLGTPVNILRGYEGDVMPPGGDNQVTLADWIKAGRFAAHLDTPAPGNESIRADCSPYIVNDVLLGGDGAFSLGDWIQVGRLAAGLDPIRPQTGPGASVASARPPAAPRLAQAGSGSPAAGSRLLRATPLQLAPGESGEISVELVAAGDENGAAFSLTLDPGLLEFQGASLGRDTTGGTLVVNPNQLGGGQLGILVALPTDAHLPAGTRQMVSLRVKATDLTGDWTNAVDFLDFPVRRQVVDPNALDLPTAYANSAVVIGTAPLPTARIADVQRVDGALRFRADGFAGRTFVVEVSENLKDWAPVPVEVGNDNTIQLPFAETMPGRFYRLRGQ